MQQPYQLSPQQLRRLTIAEWIFTEAANRALTDVGLEGLFDLQDDEQREILHDELVDLEDLGWIGNLVTPLSFGNYSCHLTAVGAEAIEDLIRHRGDAAQRRKAARDVVLRDLYDQKVGVSRRSTTFYGAPFSDDERDEALSWLHQRGYVKGQAAANGVIYAARISAQGEDCVEADRSANESNTFSWAPAQPTVIATIIGDNNTLGQTGAGDINQTATTVITEAEQKQVLQLVTSYEQVRSLLGLAPADTETADAAAAELKTLAAKPGVLKRQVLPALKSLAEGIGSSASSGAGELLVEGIKKLISSLQ